MRIFTNKSFRFDHPAEADQSVIVRAGDFSTVPDWVADTAIYSLATSDGDLMVIDNKEAEIAAELQAGSTGKKTKAATTTN